MAKRPWYVFCFWGASRSESGGGLCTMAGGPYGSRERALTVGTERLTGYYADDQPDRIQIRSTEPGKFFHPLWLYLDGLGKVCLWQKHPSQKGDIWGFTSGVDSTRS